MSSHPVSCLAHPLRKPSSRANTREHDTIPKVEETAMRTQFDTENMKEKHADLEFSVVVDIQMI